MANLFEKYGSAARKVLQQPLLTSSSEPCQFSARSFFPIHTSTLCFQTASTVINFRSSTNQARSRKIFVGEISRARWVCLSTGGKPIDFHPPQPRSHREPESSIANVMSVSQLLTMISLPTVDQSELSLATRRETDSWRRGKRFSSVGTMSLRVSAIPLSCDAVDA